jgi:hypothetical protein
MTQPDNATLMPTTVAIVARRRIRFLEIAIELRSISVYRLRYNHERYRGHVGGVL